MGNSDAGTVSARTEELFQIPDWDEITKFPDLICVNPWNLWLKNMNYR